MGRIISADIGTKESKISGLTDISKSTFKELIYGILITTVEVNSNLGLSDVLNATNEVIGDIKKLRKGDSA